jgi:peptidyl-prolyl cis-trans isomerase SurA
MNTRQPILWAIALLLGASAHAQLRMPTSPPPAGAAPGGPAAAPAFAPSAAPAPAFAPSASPAFAPAAPAAASGARASGPQLVDRVVAIVNSDAITERELDARMRSIVQRLRGQGSQLPPEDELRRQVLDRMISDRAALQAAREAGIRLDEATLDRTIARIAQDRGLSVAQLRERVESEGTPYAAFRQEIATEMSVGRLRERDIDARVQVSEAEIDAYIAEQAGGAGAPPEYNIAQILVRVPEDASAEAIEAARQRAEGLAREARGGADLARLVADAQRASDAVSGGVIGLRPAERLPPLFVQAVEPLSPGEVAPVVRSPAGFHVLKLLDRRNVGIARIASTPVRQTRARHILVRIDELNPEAEVVRRLTEIRGRIEGGTVEFADMARQYSKDGSASQGGDLGWIYPGDTVPEFERAMDALEPKQVAGPVRTPFGYHLIQVLERRTDEASPERIRAAARQALRERKAAEAFQEWMAQARDRAYVQLRLDER